MKFKNNSLNIKISSQNEIDLNNLNNNIKILINYVDITIKNLLFESEEESLLIQIDNNILNNKYLSNTLDEEYYPIDEEFYPIDEENYPIDEEYYPIDKDYNPIDEEFYPIDEEKLNINEINKINEMKLLESKFNKNNNINIKEQKKVQRRIFNNNNVNVYVKNNSDKYKKISPQTNKAINSNIKNKSSKNNLIESFYNFFKKII